MWRRPRFAGALAAIVLATGLFGIDARHSYKVAQKQVFLGDSPLFWTEERFAVSRKYGIVEARMSAVAFEGEFVNNAAEQQYYWNRALPVPQYRGLHKRTRVAWKHGFAVRSIGVPDDFNIDFVEFVANLQHICDRYIYINIGGWRFSGVIHNCPDVQPSMPIFVSQVGRNAYIDIKPSTLVCDEKLAVKLVGVNGSLSGLVRVSEGTQHQPRAYASDYRSYPSYSDLYPRGHDQTGGRSSHILLGAKIAALIAVGIASAGIGIALAFRHSYWLDRLGSWMFLCLGLIGCATFYGWAAFGAPWEFWRLPVAWGRYWLGVGQ